MKKLYLFIVVSSVCIGVYAQGTIRGTVVDDNGIPLLGATIMLTATEGMTSDAGGNYSFADVAKGSYSVTVSYIGFFDRTKSVSISDVETVTLDFDLRPSTELLQGVEITGRRATSYKNDVSYSATKTATAIKDIPQAISYVTKELFADQQAYRVNDVVKNVSGINQFSFYNDYTIRGFRSQQELIKGNQFMLNMNDAFEKHHLKPRDS